MAKAVNRNLPTKVADYFLLLGASQTTLLSLFASHAPSQLVSNHEEMISESDYLELPSKFPQEILALQADKPPSPSHILPTSLTKKQLLTSSNVRPDILYRYPQTDQLDAELPRDIHLFVYPRGYSFLDKVTGPEGSSFLLTEADGARVYCTYLTIYQPLHVVAQQLASQHTISQSRLSPNDRSPLSFDLQHLCDNFEGWIPHSICISSHWPFYEQFTTFLTQIYHRLFQSFPSYSPNYIQWVSTTVPHSPIPSSVSLNQWHLPIERYIMNFIHETPLPPQGKIIVESPGIFAPISFSRPPPNKFPQADYSLKYIFQWLSVENIMLIFSAILTERKVLFVSSHINRLTITAESFTSLLFPFNWQNMYVPVLPLSLIDFVCAPMAFIGGVLQSYLPSEVMLDQVVVVSLNENVVKPVNVSIPVIPDSKINSMIKILKKNASDMNSFDDDLVRQTFFNFFVRMMKNYRTYLLPVSSSQGMLQKFDKTAFIVDNSDMSLFLQELTETQLFQVFVDERYEAINPKIGEPEDFVALLFDESIDKELGKPTPFLSDTSQAHGNEPYKVLPPLETDLPMNWQALIPGSGTYSTSTSSKGDKDKNPCPYDLGLPLCFQDVLFGQPRFVKPLIKAETTSKVSSHERFSDFSSMNMRFFADKRQYSQHFHNLRLKSSKQDVLFQQMSNLMMNQLSHEESIVHSLSLLRSCALAEDLQTTMTSVDKPWSSWRLLLEKNAQRSHARLIETRDKLFFPMISRFSEYEQKLKNLFSEATKLEAMTGQSKTSMERAKTRYEIAKKRYMDLVSLSSTSGDSIFDGFSSQQLQRVIAAHSSMEDAGLELDQAEISFQMILHDYNVRMPEVIKEIRQANFDRILLFKTKMSQYTHILNTKMLENLQAVGDLRNDINDINVEDDIMSFSTGTFDFWNPTGSASIGPSASVSMRASNESSRNTSITKTVLSPLSETRNSSASIPLSMDYVPEMDEDGSYFYPQTSTPASSVSTSSSNKPSSKVVAPEVDVFKTTLTGMKNPSALQFGLGRLSLNDMDETVPDESPQTHTYPAHANDESHFDTHDEFDVDGGSLFANGLKPAQGTVPSANMSSDSKLHSHASTGSLQQSQSTGFHCSDDSSASGIMPKVSFSNSSLGRGKETEISTLSPNSVVDITLASSANTKAASRLGLDRDVTTPFVSRGTRRNSSIAFDLSAQRFSSTSTDGSSHIVSADISELEISPEAYSLIHGEFHSTTTPIYQASHLPSTVSTSSSNPSPNNGVESDTAPTVSVSTSASLSASVSVSLDPHPHDEPESLNHYNTVINSTSPEEESNSVVVCDTHEHPCSDSEKNSAFSSATALVTPTTFSANTEHDGPISNNGPSHPSTASTSTSTVARSRRRSSTLEAIDSDDEFSDFNVNALGTDAYKGFDYSYATPTASESDAPGASTTSMKHLTLLDPQAIEDALKASKGLDVGYHDSTASPKPGDDSEHNPNAPNQTPRKSSQGLPTSPSELDAFKTPNPRADPNVGLGRLDTPLIVGLESDEDSNKTTLPHPVGVSHLEIPSHPSSVEGTPANKDQPKHISNFSPSDPTHTPMSTSVASSANSSRYNTLRGTGTSKSGFAGFLQAVKAPSVPPSTNSMTMRSSRSLVRPHRPVIDELSMITFIEPGKTFFRAPAINDQIHFPISLWGNDGFEYALNVCQNTKDISKEFMLFLEAFAGVTDAQAKRLFAISKNLSVPEGYCGPSLQDAFDGFRDQVRVNSHALGYLSCVLMKCAFSMRLLKGELKQARKRYADHRVKLAKELIAAKEAWKSASEREQKALNAVRVAMQKSKTTATQANIREIERSNNLVLKLQAEYKELSHVSGLLERTYTATRKKHDICVARLLLLLERKEKKASLEYQFVLFIVREWIHIKICQTHENTTIAIRGLLNAVDIGNDIFVMVSTLCNDRIPTPCGLLPFNADNEGEVQASRSNYSTALYQSCDAMLNQVDDTSTFIRSIATMLDELVNSHETELKHLKRFSFSFSKPSFHKSLQAAFVSLSGVMTGYQKLSESLTFTYRSISKSLQQYRKHTKDSFLAMEKDLAEHQKLFDIVTTEREKASRELKSANDSVSGLSSKKKEMDLNPNEKDREKKSFFTKSPYETLTNKLDTAQKELLRAQQNFSSKEALLETESAKFQQAKVTLFERMFNVQIEVYKQLYEVAIQLQEGSIRSYAELNQSLVTLDKSVCSIDSANDLLIISSSFTDQSNTEPILDVVLQDVAGARLAEHTETVSLVTTCSTVIAEKAALEQVRKLHKNYVSSLEKVMEASIADRTTLSHRENSSFTDPSRESSDFSHTFSPSTSDADVRLDVRNSTYDARHQQQFSAVEEEKEEEKEHSCSRVRDEERDIVHDTDTVLDERQLRLRDSCNLTLHESYHSFSDMYGLGGFSDTSRNSFSVVGNDIGAGTATTGSQSAADSAVDKEAAPPISRSQTPTLPNIIPPPIAARPSVSKLGGARKSSISMAPPVPMKPALVSPTAANRPFSARNSMNFDHSMDLPFHADEEKVSSEADTIPSIDGVSKPDDTRPSDAPESRPSDSRPSDVKLAPPPVPKRK